MRIAGQGAGSSTSNALFLPYNNSNPSFFFLRFPMNGPISLSCSAVLLNVSARNKNIRSNIWHAVAWHEKFDIGV